MKLPVEGSGDQECDSPRKQHISTPRKKSKLR